MNKIIVLAFLVFISVNAQSQIVKKIGNKIKTKTSAKADTKVDNAIDKGLNKTDAAIDGAGKKSTSVTTTATTTANTTSASTQTNIDVTATANPATFKPYNNYDFIPGEKILLEDNFETDQIGEFPTHWELQNGQAVVNKYNDKTALLITDGNSGWVSPLMKKKKYLDKEWTIEFDNYKKQETYPIIVYLQDDGKHDLGKVVINADVVEVGYLTADGVDSKSLQGAYPTEMQYENFNNKWHHIAIAYKNKQMKVYVDQVRVTVVPNMGFEPAAIGVGGLASSDAPLVFANLRIAEGAGMNMLGKKFTDTKIITHGINFDVNKAIIKPESMGTLNGIVQILKDNPELKFEVGGHTDADGDVVLNNKLSQARADAVRLQLITMGIDAARLTAKGYGKTKPISDNTSFEGKANNRRVEFVKK
jgi:OmpA-OmpF porin, OOP family